MNPRSFIPMPEEKSFLEVERIFERIGIVSDHHVADLGCGAKGHFTFPMAALVGNRGVVYAIDILKSVLQSIERESRLLGFKNIKTVWANFEKFGATKIPDSELDTALLANNLFQSRNHPAIIKEVHRLLKLGGKFIIVDWKKTAAPFGPPVEDRVEKRDITELAQANGFQLIDEFDAGEYHFALIFQKTL